MRSTPYSTNLYYFFVIFQAVDNCVGTAGFSVGEYAALVFAGSLSFEDGNICYIYICVCVCIFNLLLLLIVFSSYFL